MLPNTTREHEQVYPAEQRRNPPDHLADRNAEALEGQCR